MKHYNWNSDKNQKLKNERGLSFEEVIWHIQHGHEIDVIEHPNQMRYQGQKISVVIIDDYAYLVPFIESDTEIFLKTIIPSRQATKKYLGK